MSTEQWFSPAQIARRYGLGYRKVLRLIENKELRAILLPGNKPAGNRYRVSKTELTVFEHTHSSRRTRSPKIADGSESAAPAQESKLT